MPTKPTAYQTIARRIAEIADEHTRILHANEYDLPSELEEIFEKIQKKAEDAGEEDTYEAEEEARNELAQTYLETELEKLKAEVADQNIRIDPELLAALIPSIADITHWQSSSYGCS